MLSINSSIPKFVRPNKRQHACVANFVANTQHAQKHKMANICRSFQQKIFFLQPQVAYPDKIYLCKKLRSKFSHLGAFKSSNSHVTSQHIFSGPSVSPYDPFLYFLSSPIWFFCNLLPVPFMYSGCNKYSCAAHGTFRYFELCSICLREGLGCSKPATNPWNKHNNTTVGILLYPSLTEPSSIE
jgi:hypothetical protein